VTARFDTVSVTQVGTDRVAITGAKGEPPPATLKVAMNELGGFRTDLNVALTGLDIEAKARLVEDAFWMSASVSPDGIESVTARLVRTDKEDPASNEEAVALWRITLKDADERKVGKGVAGAINELALATIPGLFAVGGSSMAKPFGVYRPALVPADLVPQHVVVLGGARVVVESVAPAGQVSVVAAPVDLPPSPGGDTVRLPLGRVFGSRSGDKGGNANLGVFARTAEAYAWIESFLTVRRLQELLPESADLRVERFALANIWSLNFVLHGLLQEGVAASTRQDGQAKGLGEWLRARVVDLPTALVQG
jgi:hypothetical protein